MTRSELEDSVVTALDQRDAKAVIRGMCQMGFKFEAVAIGESWTMAFTNDEFARSAVGRDFDDTVIRAGMAALFPGLGPVNNSWINSRDWRLQV